MISVKRHRTSSNTKMLNYLRFGVKTIIFLFWASLYIMVMRITILELTSGPPVQEWSGVPDHRFQGGSDVLVKEWMNVPHHQFQGGWDPIVKEWINVPEHRFKRPNPADDDIDSGPEIDWPEPENITIMELQRRAKRVEAVCRRRAINETLNSREFFVDYVNNLVWCNIFKAASSSWLYNFNLLAGYDRKFLAETIMEPLRLARRKFPRPSPEQLLEAVNTPDVVSLLIVRDPFVRLLSAYRDKLEGKVPSFYKGLSDGIVNMHRHKTMKALGPLYNLGPTFSEFVAYLIQTHRDNTTFDEHWAPYYQFCSPCAVKFTVIAKVETLSRDSAYVLYRLRLAHILGRRVLGRKMKLRSVMNRSKDGRKTADLLELYFGQIDENMLNDLLEIYGIDFEMFGYDAEIYRQYVRKQK